MTDRPDESRPPPGGRKRPHSEADTLAHPLGVGRGDGGDTPGAASRDDVPRRPIPDGGETDTARGGGGERGERGDGDGGDGDGGGGHGDGDSNGDGGGDGGHGDGDGDGGHGDGDSNGDGDDGDDDEDDRLNRIVRDVSQAVLFVFALGVLLFLITGAWPAIVTVNGDSMEPHVESGSLMIVTASDRFGPGAAIPQHSGIVTRDAGDRAGYRQFGAPGDLIVFTTPSGQQVIHRPLVHVEAGENWTGRVAADRLAGDNCSEVRFCPAPRSGFITRGDGNPYVDQVYGIPPVTPDNITGVARYHLSVP